MLRTMPLSAIPASPKKKGVPHRCRFPAPLRASERTPDGWIDREWKEGERKAYEETVLGKPQLVRM